MGGSGSGRRPSYAGKNTTEESMPLDIRKLQRAGALRPWHTCAWEWTHGDRAFASITIHAGVGFVTLAYSYAPRGQPPEAVRQTITMTTTACNLGGQRSWFICPDCRARVAVVYGAGRLFGCRRCKGLAYSSQSELADDRAARRANRIRKRLGWEPGYLNGDGLKPRGMHWRTYWTLKVEHDALVSVSVAGISRRFGFVQRSD